MKLAWRSPKFFEEPGLFLIRGKTELCLLPWMKARR